MNCISSSKEVQFKCFTYVPPTPTNIGLHQYPFSSYDEHFVLDLYISACECNNYRGLTYSASCLYDVIKATGICQNCQLNTQGDKCEECMRGYTLNPAVNNPNVTYPNGTLCSGMHNRLRHTTGRGNLFIIERHWLVTFVPMLANMFVRNN